MSDEFTPGYGRMLAEAREAKGLTIAQVAEKLKLSTRQIEALEAEDYSRLPVAVFVRGFIRNYARLVEVPLDSLPAIAEIPVTPTETITAHSEELRFSASPVRRWLLLPMAVFGLFLVLVAVLYAWLSQGEEAYVPNQPAVSDQAIPLVLPPPAEPAPEPAPAAVAPPVPVVDPAASPAASPAAAGSASPAAPVVLSPVAPSPVQAPAPVQPRPAVPVPTAPPPARPAPGAINPYLPPAVAPAVPAPAPASARPAHVVQLTAEQTDAWIEVVAGDDKRYTRLLRVGEQLTLRGAPPFRLVVGNAATVRLSYDGRAIDLKPYTGDKVARLTLE